MQNLVMILVYLIPAFVCIAILVAQIKRKMAKLSRNIRRIKSDFDPHTDEPGATPPDIKQ